MTRIEELSLSVQCPRCRARGWCVTASGQRAAALHGRRTQPFREAFAEGYMTGRSDMARALADKT